jgi:hypothetical protein
VFAFGARVMVTDGGRRGRSSAVRETKRVPHALAFGARGGGWQAATRRDVSNEKIIIIGTPMHSHLGQG